ncbi:cytochrome P450 [Streptacidiphilus sp. ASG 303]|uniref:cytochrome P450 family protein n=1 Tax=Streptacidiphilus sp. ASG 303 TaxID=2896847 RepID=UPI001E54D3A7|nr:cytochrome P450 [Streptacidiphilus sp. ASG 303]MCD0483368.1 cytochrome P450 [Streptacidiphilus sp. ASG 303]
MTSDQPGGGMRGSRDGQDGRSRQDGRDPSAADGGHQTQAPAPGPDPGPPLVGTPDFKADAHARYAALRARGPVHRVRFARGLEGWLVVGHDAAREALLHPALGKDTAPAEAALEAAGYLSNRPGVGLGGNMLTADPPEHTRLRRLVAGAFTPRRTEALAPRVREIADRLVDAFAPLGEADLVASFTAPLPMTVICELLGVPEEQRDGFRTWSQQALGNPPSAAREGAAALSRFLADLLAAKRARPGDDLLSALVAVRDEDDGRLSDTELVGTAVLLVVAGHETTVNLLGNALMALLRHPGQARLLRERPELLPGAVEEFLRYDAPVELTPQRFAAADVELGGCLIRRGDIVQVALTSVGRDGSGTGTADPDALDVTRDAARHLSFGHGIHYCLGAPLARLEAAVALGTLLRRLPGLEAAVPLDEVAWIPSGIMRGPVALPVRFTPQPGAALPGQAAAPDARVPD